MLQLPLSSPIIFKKNIQTTYSGFGVFTVVTTRTKSSIFWDITPYSPVKVNRRFEGTHCPTICSMLVFCLGYSSTPKMEVIYSSKTSADSHWTAWCYTPEHRTLQTTYRQRLNILPTTKTAYNMKKCKPD
jgi:hypothetical protein